MRHTFNLKFFLRFLNRHRLYTAINVFGFSVSLMFVILIAAYVAKELSADRHHVNGDRIYRFEHQDFAYSAYAAGRVLQDRFPEIESYCVVSYENKTLRIGEEYMQVAVDCVDSSFFHMFTIELEQGDPRHVLATRDGVVINSKFAKTLFGEESPMGKVLDIDDRQLTVTGVFADFPYGIFRTPQLITSIFNTDNLWCIESYMDCHSWELFLMARRNADLYLLQAAVDVGKFLYKASGGSVSLGDLSVENTAIHGLPKTLDDLLNNPGDNLTYQDYASDIREILAYNRTQHKDIMSGLNVQFVIADGTFQIKD